METEIFAVKGSDTLRLDRYFLSGIEQTDSPVVVFVFGGGFRFGERYSEMFVPYFEFLARHGCTVASIDYRTMLGRITFDGRSSPVDFMNILQSAIDTAVVDLYDATQYIAQQREAWGIDPEKIVISGSSAGAITVLQAAVGPYAGDRPRGSGRQEKIYRPRLHQEQYLTDFCI